MLLGDLENLVVFKVDNEDFEPIGQINQITSVTWGKKFNAYFDVVINAPVTEENKKLFKKGRIIWAGPKYHSAAIIDIINTKRSTKGLTTFEVKARTLECLLMKRVIPETVKFYNEALSTIMYELVDKAFVNPEDEARKLPYFRCDTDLMIGPKLSKQITGGDIYTAITELCLKFEYIKFEVLFFPDDKEIVFKVSQTINHTSENPGRYYMTQDGKRLCFNNGYPWLYRWDSETSIKGDIVILSDETEDIISDEYYYNGRDGKNFAYVAGAENPIFPPEAPQIHGRIVVPTDEVFYGFERNELYVDARDLQTENTEEEAIETVDEYERRLKRRGEDKLADCKDTETFEGEVRIDKKTSFVFGVDYEIGDKIVVSDAEIGISTNAVVYCLQEKLSDKYEAQLTLGYEPPTLLQKIKNNL